jgi:hypothetical protein
VETGIVEVEVGKKVVDQIIRLEMKLTKEKQKGIVRNWLHGWSPKPPGECVPLMDPKLVNLEDKKQVHHLICKACRPIFGDRQEANGNKTGISVQGDCRWDQKKEAGLQLGLCYSPFSWEQVLKNCSSQMYKSAMFQM